MSGGGEREGHNMYRSVWFLTERVAAGRGCHSVHFEAADGVGEASLTCSTRKQKARFA